MTETEYQAAICAERMFGQIQVHQHARKLAADLGLPADCMEPPVRRAPRRPRWSGGVDPAEAAYMRALRVGAILGMGIQHPNDYASFKVTSVA